MNDKAFDIWDELKKETKHYPALKNQSQYWVEDELGNISSMTLSELLTWQNTKLEKNPNVSFESFYCLPLIKISNAAALRESLEAFEKFRLKRVQLDIEDEKEHRVCMDNLNKHGQH